MVTIYDIAKKMKLSHTTVSMALRGLPCVRESTRMRVAETAVKLGYKKNQAAASLKRGACRRIALILSNYEVYFDLIDKLEELGRADGYELVLMHLDESPEKMRQTFTQLLSGGCAGAASFIYNYSTISDMADEYIGEKRPFVTLNLASDLKPRPGLFRLDVSGVEAASEAVSELLRLGHSRIAVPIFCYAFSSFASDKYYKYAVLKKLLAAAGMEPPWDPRFLYKAHYPLDHMRDGYDAADAILKEKRGVTAILCKNDQFAFGMMRRLKELGINVPGDISLLGAGNSKLARFSGVRLTTIDTMQTLMAEKIWSILSANFAEPNFERIEPAMIIPGKLVAGESFAQAAER